MERETPSTQFYYPYVMNPGLTTGDNDVDNVEQVNIPAAPSGTYRIIVTWEGSLVGQQPFSLIVSGMAASCNYSLHHGYIYVQPGNYAVENDITSIGTVSNGDNVNYSAGVNIKLKPGFKSEWGSTFKAELQSCN